MSAPHEPRWQPVNPPAPAVPVKRGSWFARHKVLTALGAVALVLAVAAALGGGGDETATSASPGIAASDRGDGAGSRTGAGQDARGVGDKVRDGKFEFTVTGVETGVASVGGSFLEQKAQGQFVLVHLMVRNIGTEAQTMFDSNQTVKDVAGREFSADSAAALAIEGNEDVWVTDVNPGNSVTGIVVFDMPKKARPASIELHDSAFSGGVTVDLRADVG